MKLFSECAFHFTNRLRQITNTFSLDFSDLATSFLGGFSQCSNKYSVRLNSVQVL